jgi:hypothetical protein
MKGESEHTRNVRRQAASKNIEPIVKLEDDDERELSKLHRASRKIGWFVGTIHFVILQVASRTLRYRCRGRPPRRDRRASGCTGAAGEGYRDRHSGAGSGIRRVPIAPSDGSTRQPSFSRFLARAAVEQAKASAPV